MDERRVVDASPLIALGTIGHLELLTAVATEVVVPESVAREVMRVDDAASRSLQEIGLPREDVVPDAQIVSWGLGEGETAVLSRRGGAGRRPHGQTLRFRCRRVHAGTLGVVVLAKKTGVISSAAELVDRLRDTSLYLSPELVSEMLRLAGEVEDD